MHEPVTTQYTDNLVLMNIDFNGYDSNQETACIIIKDNNLIKIDWNRKYMNWEEARHYEDSIRHISSPPESE